MTSQYKSLKNISSILFGFNYAGIIYGAFTFTNESEEQKKHFLLTAAKHTLFISNNYLIHFLKFELKWLRLLNASNDLAGFLVCFPNYALYMYPSIEYFLKKDKSSGLFDQEQIKNLQNEKGLTKQQILNQYLEKQSAEDLLLKLDDQNKQNKKLERFRELYHFYKVENKVVSDGIEYAGYGILMSTLVWMAKLRYKK